TRTLWEVKVNTNKPPQDSKPLRVTVIGHQWWWEYQYEPETSKPGVDTRMITANELHVPASNFAIATERRPVYLTLQSADVAHSFGVPGLAGKTDLFRGRTNRMWLETARQEWFLGQCAEFCGTQPAKMLWRVKVDSPAEFDRWLENEQKPAVDDPKM